MTIESDVQLEQRVVVLIGQGIVFAKNVARTSPRLLWSFVSVTKQGIGKHLTENQMSVNEDPVYRHSKREAIFILILWAGSFAWTVPYCYFNGYQTTQDNWTLELTFGLPSWVVWGVAVPWVVCGIISILLCFFLIQDDDLGRADDELATNADAPT